METVTDFIFLGAKITADGEFSHEIKRRLSLGRKVMINLDSILKNRDYLANNGLSSQSYDFSNIIVCQGTEAFELWCWRRLLRVPWMAKRSNQSILKEINPEYSL